MSATPGTWVIDQRLTTLENRLLVLERQVAEVLEKLAAVEPRPAG